MFNPKVRAVLDRIVELFRTGNVPKAISVATYPPFIVPSNAWSLANRLIMAVHGTSDARGFNQWKEVKRYVRKGSKSFFILAPWIGKRKQESAEDNPPNHISKVLRGFLAVPVFAVESTEGEPLSYQKLELPPLPLQEVAEAWGIDVAPVAFQGFWLGYYRPDDEREEIRLATSSQKTFLHELSHAAHKRVLGSLNRGQDWRQEIVAELSAQSLCHLVCIDPGATIGNSFEYIKFYSEKAGKDIGAACVSVLSDVEKVLNLILETSRSVSPAAVPANHP
ncbi:antirestriction protein [bacterium]|nr:antirestriction protein [candidate division CSSED10-310 bacterium]